MERKDLLNRLANHVDCMKDFIQAAELNKCSDEMLWGGLEEQCKEMAMLAADPDHPFDEESWATGQDDEDEEMTRAAFELVPTRGMH